MNHPEVEEKWEPLLAKDQVFHVSEDGNVVVAGTRAGGMFGSIVRKRAGTWMKQTQPMVILLGPAIYARLGKGDFRMGSELIG